MQSLWPSSWTVAVGRKGQGSLPKCSKYEHITYFGVSGPVMMPILCSTGSPTVADINPTRPYTYYATRLRRVLVHRVMQDLYHQLKGLINESTKGRVFHMPLGCR